NAATAAAYDFTGPVSVEAMVKNLPFLSGIRTAKIVGNFAPPGMNFAGTLTYPDPQTAQAAAQSIDQTNATIKSYSLFLQLAGIGNPIQKLETVASGNDAQFVLGLESRTVEWLLNQLAIRLGASPTPVPATPRPTYLQQAPPSTTPTPLP